MLFEVFDAVGIMDLAVRAQCFAIGHAVFGDDHGQTVAIIDLAHPNMQAHRVNALIHPLGFAQVGIITDVEGVRHPEGRLVVVDGTLLDFGANAEIVVDADEVGGRGFQHGCISGQRLGVKPMTL